MCEPTKLKFELPVGTWGTTEVEVEYPWHRDLDSIILPLLETAHEAQAERQKETRDLRLSEVYRTSHLAEQRTSELRSPDHRQSLHSSDHHRTPPSANAAKVIMSTSAKRKKGKDKNLPSRPNDEVRVCLKGVDSTKWMTMMRGDYFQNLLDAYAKECEPQKDVTRLKMFWKGRWVKTMETPDDLALEADAKFEVYELVQTRPKLLASCIPKGHQRDPSKASIKTIKSMTTSDDRSITAPTEAEASANTAAIKVEDRRFSAAESMLSPNSSELGSMKATMNPTEFQMPADILSWEVSDRTDHTGHSSAESEHLADGYQAQRIDFHNVRYDVTKEGVKEVSVPSPVTTVPQDPSRLQVPPPASAQRSRNPSLMRLGHTPTEVFWKLAPDSPVMLDSFLEPGHEQQRRQSIPFTVSGASEHDEAPMIPPLRATKSQEGDLRASVAGYRYQKAALRDHARGSSSLKPAVLSTTIESGGRKVISTYRTSWP